MKTIRKEHKMKIRKAKIYAEGLTAKDTKTIKKLFNAKKVEKEDK